MAHDLMWGETPTDWSRGDVLTALARRKATASLRSIPWGKVALGIGLLGTGLLLLPKLTRSLEVRGMRRAYGEPGRPTLRIPRQNMRETVYGK
jgi:hypothetical protein